MISIILHYLFDNFTLVSASVAVLLLYYFSTSTYDKWQKEKVPHMKPIPLFGNLAKALLGLESQYEGFDRIYRQFPDEKICGFYQMKTPYLMIRDPELIKTILIKDFAHFTDHGFYLDSSINLISNGLFFTNGQRWKIMRQKLSPGFTSSKLKLMYGQVKNCSKDLLSYISKKSSMSDEIEIHDLFGKYATDVVGTCAFGLKLGSMSDEGSEFRKYGKQLFKPTFRQLIITMLGMISPKIPNKLKIQQLLPDVIDFFDSTFKEFITYREKNDINRNDVAQTLMQARNKFVLNNDSFPEEKFTDTDIIANAIFLFFAGTEPVSNTLAFCVYELALNKPIQEKLRQHICETREKHGGEYNHSYLADLHYADMVLLETMRKYSGAIVLFREVTKTYPVPGQSLVIEKGQKIIIPTYSFRHDPKYYPDPDIFDPERFSPEEKAKRPNATELFFGDGPRFCIGKRLADLELKLGLSEIIYNFELLPCSKTENPIQLLPKGMIVKPKNGVWLSLKPIIRQ
ncbi:putative cytochrome P450 6a13 [Aphis craccivora]|uniref:Putative cytochrome P450 6a13 n=1 Tax=Aphis craccivora TaxID=307492 RepID=A0A6G0X3K8_APHCR|nr:putative cytochrome P450 6a13 [Aphis craccivora]